VDGYAQGPQWEPGTVVGDHEVVEHIASGGMAEVYAAVPVAGGEPVVLKAMSRHLLANEEFVRMFLDEAQLIATLRHPHIGQIYDRGEHRGTHYFVMEYVLGTSCREILHRSVRDRVGHVPLAHAIDIGCDIAAALHYAHERRAPGGGNFGIVHRDVSHSNVMITFDGVTKLIDFGVAKSTMRSTETKVGSIKGKVRYMSPEQIRGEVVDRRSDLFSLGIMLWELTTGARLFRAANEAATMHKIVFEEVRRPSDALPGYPPELERIVLGALARSPAERPRTGAELAQQLAEFAERAGLERGGIARYLRDLYGDEIDRARHRFSELQRRGLARRGGAALRAGAAPAAAARARSMPGLIAAVPIAAPPPERFAAGAPTVISPPPELVDPEAPRPRAPHAPLGELAPPAGLGTGSRTSREARRRRHARDRRALLLLVLTLLGIIAAGLALSRLAQPPAPRGQLTPTTDRLGLAEDASGAPSAVATAASRTDLRPKL
jgi:serine/threonine-protein kinase